MVMNPKTQIIELDADTAAALKSRADERGISVSDVVTELVPLALGQSEIDELDRRWAAVNAGAATVSQKEVERWLRSWSTAAFKPRERS